MAMMTNITWMEDASLDAVSGSVIPKQDLIVPLRRGSSHRFFCSGVPNLYWIEKLCQWPDVPAFSHINLTTITSPISPYCRYQERCSLLLQEPKEHYDPKSHRETRIQRWLAQRHCCLTVETSSWSRQHNLVKLWLLGWQIWRFLYQRPIRLACCLSSSTIGGMDQRLGSCFICASYMCSAGYTYISMNRHSLSRNIWNLLESKWEYKAIPIDSSSNCIHKVWRWLGKWATMRYFTLNNVDDVDALSPASVSITTMLFIDEA